MKVTTVVGARPQFIKAAPVSKTLREAGHQECLIHTEQHYDYGMSQVSFEELGIPEPDVNLGVGSGPQRWQTGQKLIRVLGETYNSRFWIGSVKQYYALHL